MKVSRNTNEAAAPVVMEKGTAGSSTIQKENTLSKVFAGKAGNHRIGDYAGFICINGPYRIIRDNNEQYNKIVLTQRQQV